MSDTLQPQLEIPLPVNYDSPQALSVMLESLGLGMRKKFGQNFLVNKNARSRIAAQFLAPKNGLAWEIGPGFGAMSYEALLLGLNLVSFEIDKGFASFMNNSYSCVPNFKLIEGDFVKTWKEAYKEKGSPYLAFGNLPYNAAGMIIASLIEGEAKPDRMVFTVQKEAAQRICAKVSTKNYASFSVLCQASYNVKTVFDLSAGSFWPQPRVTSSVVVMEKRKNPIPFAGEVPFTRFTRASFASRRKTMRNNLKAASYNDDSILNAFSKANIRPDARAESLLPEQFSQLFALINSK